MTERLRPISYSTIKNWLGDDHCRAFECWQKSAALIAANPPKTRMNAVEGTALQSIARLTPLEISSQTDARHFFETFFEPAHLSADPGLRPEQLRKADHKTKGAGFVTGYFEPVHAARAVRSELFPVPLLRRPPNLIRLTEDNRPDGWPQDSQFEWMVKEQVIEAPDRAAIENGALDGQGLELAWLADPVEAYFIHIQGSAWLDFPDGTQLRITYDGKSGHDYISIGQLAIQRGYLPAANSGKRELETWLRDHPAEGYALMQENRSYIFFKSVDCLRQTDGPIGAADVALTPGRSLAIDHRLMTFHTPIWIDILDGEPLSEQKMPAHRLMVAQDTGSAIRGFGRGDIFVGSGTKAGDFAGALRHDANMTILCPRLLDESS